MRIIMKAAVAAVAAKGRELRHMATYILRGIKLTPALIYQAVLVNVMLFGTLILLARPLRAEAATSQSPQTQSGKTCQYDTFGGLIQDRWRELGGPNSALGCPLEPHERVGWDNADARVVWYENGMGSWSPWTGVQSVLFAWREGQNVHVWWKTTDPWNYDKWQVNWRDGGAELDNQPRSEGQFVFSGSWYRDYNITVQGCDNPGFLGHTHCGEGWMHPVVVVARIPGLRAEVKVGDQVQVLYDGDTALRDALDPMWGAYRAKAKRTLRDTLQNNPQIHDFTFDLAEEGEARAWMDGQTLVMEYSIPGWVDAHVNTGPVPGIVGNPEFRADFDMVFVLTIPVSNPRGRFEVADAHVEVRNVRIDSGNLFAGMIKDLAPFLLRYAARKITDEANNDPRAKLTDTVNAFLLPITNALLKVPPGFVYLNAWVDYKAKVHLQFGPGRVFAVPRVIRP